MSPFHGTVNPNGAETTYKWEYGTTKSLGSETSAVNAGEGTTKLFITTPVQGLEAGRRYWFRLSATNKYGTSVTTLTEQNTARFNVRNGTFPQNYSQSGSVTFYMPTVGTGSTIKCGIGSGVGTIEAPEGGLGGGVIKLYELGLTGCEWVGTPGCNPTSVTALKLKSSLRSWYGEGLTTIKFNSNTCGWFDMTLVEQEPFRITKMPSGTWGSSKTMEFAGNTKFGTNPIEITGVLNINVSSGAELSWFW